MAYTLSHLLIGGFKAFRNLQRIPIKKITLLYGPNNSGKSSILHSLLYAKRLSENPSEYLLNLPWVPDNGTSNKLPGFSGLVHGNNPKGKMTLGWEVTNADSRLYGNCIKQINIIDPNAEFPLLDQRLTVDGNLIFDSLANSDLEGPGLPLKKPLKELMSSFMEACSQALLDLALSNERLDDDFRAVLRTQATEINDRNSYKRLYAWLTSSPAPLAVDYRFFPARARVRSDFSDLTSIFLPPGGAALALLRSGNPALAAREIFDRDGISPLPRDVRDGLSFSLGDSFLERMADYFSALLGRFFLEAVRPYEGIINGTFLGPHRSVPEFLFRSSPHFVDDRRHPEWQISQNRIDLINKWLKSHDQLNDSLSLEIHDYVSNSSHAGTTFSAGTPVRLVLYDHKRKVRLGLQDVGYGISQALPILIACQRWGGSLIVEQPELHLHPRLQCELGDVFINAVTREEDPLNHVICETHSEHLLLRLLRRIREGTFSNDDLSVVYIESRGKESVAVPMPVNEDGELVRDWPGGFFEEGLREMLM